LSQKPSQALCTRNAYVDLTNTLTSILLESFRLCFHIPHCLFNKLITDFYTDHYDYICRRIYLLNAARNLNGKCYCKAKMGKDHRKSENRIRSLCRENVCVNVYIYIDCVCLWVFVCSWIMTIRVPAKLLTAVSI
jgi:hypothetical protein